MSIQSSLLVFLLFISLHACNARRLGAITHHPDEPAPKFLLPNKNDEKGSYVNTPPVTTILKPSLTKKTRVDDHNYNPMSSEAKEMKHQGVKEISAPPQSSDQSSLSVSTWLLPHRIPPGQNQPGFNLDYSPSETHPPVNN